MKHRNLTRGGLYFDDFEVGDVISSTGRTVTEADLVNFSGITGAMDPLHIDLEYCKSTVFGERIAHGPLVMAISFGLVERVGLLQGTILAFLGVKEWDITGPVRIGDTIRATDTVVEKKTPKKPLQGILTFQREIINQRDEVVQTFAWLALVKRRSEAEVKRGMGE